MSGHFNLTIHESLYTKQYYVLDVIFWIIFGIFDKVSCKAL